MSVDVPPFARMLLLAGGLLVACGLVVLVAPKVSWLGRLPGDIAIQREGVSFYLPLTSCVLASLLVSVVWWVMQHFR